MRKLQHWLAATSLIALTAGCDGQATVVTDQASPQPTASASDVVETSVAASYAQAWGPAIGEAMPVLDAPDQGGEQQTLASLSGDQGMLLFLNRSADW